MDNKKYEHLINLVINENREQASELFHEIVVEKSREIFESIMAEEFEDDMEEGMGGEVGDLMDEITAEEEGTGMHEDADDEADIEFDDSAEEAGEEMTHDIEMGGEEEGEETEHAEIEDSVIRIEDKLDQLMAEFEEIMGGSSEGEEVEVSDEEEALSEAVQLQKVSVTHGDNGVQNKSTVAANSGQKGMDSKPVKFSNTENEKGRPAPTTKDLKGAGQFKNTPGKKTVDLSAAPKPKKGDDGSNTKSPVAK